LGKDGVESNSGENKPIPTNFSLGEKNTLAPVAL
jgi:hypothetical protein